jgi:cell division protein FtsQ
MKRLKQIVLWSFVLAYFPVILAFVNETKDRLVCADVVVKVTDSLQTQFVSEKEIRNAVVDRFKDMLGKPFQKVDFEEVEQFVEKHPAVKSCEVYNTLGGYLRIEIVQHLPLLRVFKGSKTYYLDEDGTEMPVFESFTARVLVANGSIPKNNDSLLRLARYLHNDPFWEAQMEQIYIRRNGDFVLVPRVGDHLILFGPPERIAEKLRNLKALYKAGLSPQEWNEYQIINLKYKGQILCSKNRSL